MCNKSYHICNGYIGSRFWRHCLTLGISLSRHGLILSIANPSPPSGASLVLQWLSVLSSHAGFGSMSSKRAKLMREAHGLCGLSGRALQKVFDFCRDNPEVGCMWVYVHEPRRIFYTAYTSFIYAHSGDLTASLWQKRCPPLEMSD